MSSSAKRSPWHSKDSSVHHDNAKCEEGKKIVSNRLDGTGSKPHCPECGKLNKMK